MKGFTLRGSFRFWSWSCSCRQRVVGLDEIRVAGAHGALEPLRTRQIVWNIRCVHIFCAAGQIALVLLLCDTREFTLQTVQFVIFKLVRYQLTVIVFFEFIVRQVPFINFAS